ncbi:DsrE family protein [Arcobacter sp. LA11]|uniref:DsrE family protein n=1 Tax=Arcobacter sp. LA11 TaxID=1898176 RepID=UPI00093521CD|nr:DsrE family protein [Arcobacter sp. LA11]
MKLNKKIASAFMMLFLTVGAYASEGYKNLFVTITSDSLKVSGMGVAVSNAFQSAGVNTTILIGAEAAKLALKKGKQEAFGPTGKSVKEMLVGLSKKGGKVMLCGMCAKYGEIKQSDVIEGVKIVSPGDVAGALLAPATQTLSF